MVTDYLNFIHFAYFRYNIFLPWHCEKLFASFNHGKHLKEGDNERVQEYRVNNKQVMKLARHVFYVVWIRKHWAFNNGRRSVCNIVIFNLHHLTVRFINEIISTIFRARRPIGLVLWLVKSPQSVSIFSQPRSNWWDKQWYVYHTTTYYSALKTFYIHFFNKSKSLFCFSHYFVGGLFKLLLVPNCRKKF